MLTIFLNGRFLQSAEEARLSVFDAGFQHSVGLFETMLGGVSGAGEPWVLHLDRHMDRLSGSARELGLSTDLRTGALGEAVVETVSRSALRRARVRLTVTGGDLSMLSRSGSTGQTDPTVLIVAQPATEYPEAMFERGGALVIADARANPLNPFEGHKTLNYWWRLRELQAAAAKGAAEALVLQVSNHVASGCVSNVFLVRDGTLVTPIARGEEAEVGGPGGRSLPSPVLPGITRAWVLDEADRRGLVVRREMLGAAEVLDADEVFLTNSSWGIMPMVKVEASAIGDGVPGRLTNDLRRSWRAQFD